MKTPRVLHVLSCYQAHIDAVQELKSRAGKSLLSDDRLHKLLVLATDNVELADMEVAKYILKTTKK